MGELFKQTDTIMDTDRPGIKMEIKFETLPSSVPSSDIPEG